MSLACRNLMQDKHRSTLSILGVGLAIMLILVLNGFLVGVDQAAANYLDHAPGSVVVAQKGVKNFLVSSSLLSSDTTDRVRMMKGIAQVTPILTQPVYLEFHGQKQFVEMIGYDSRFGGGPWNLVDGREPRADDEMVLDRVLAEQHGIVPGDTLPVLNRTFTVVGLSAGTSTWLTSFIFVRKTAAESLLLAPGATGFLLVTPANGISAETLRDRLSTLPGTQVMLKSELVANDVALLTRSFSAPLRLMVMIGLLVGVLIVGLIIYTATVERQREYGVLKAIGARNSRLYRVVTTQAALVAIGGSIIGIGLALGGAQLIMALRPQFLVVIEPVATLQALAAGFVIAGLSALFPGCRSQAGSVQCVCDWPVTRSHDGRSVAYCPGSFHPIRWTNGH
jgi:putative ABC transport system permease protein